MSATRYYLLDVRLLDWPFFRGLFEKESGVYICTSSFVSISILDCGNSVVAAARVLSLISYAVGYLYDTYSSGLALLKLMLLKVIRARARAIITALYGILFLTLFI